MSDYPTFFLAVEFVPGSGDGFSNYTFSHFPQAGDEVIGEDSIYEVEKISHRGGSGVFPEAHAVVYLRRVGPLLTD